MTVEELNKIRERLKNNRLSFTWLIFQLDNKGIKTDKTEVSSIFAGTRRGAKADSKTHDFMDYQRHTYKTIIEE